MPGLLDRLWKKADFRSVFLNGLRKARVDG